jgi:hypothetical protein
LCGGLGQDGGDVEDDLPGVAHHDPSTSDSAEV